MTRGRSGSLHLLRMDPSSTTSRRLRPAHCTCTSHDPTHLGPLTLTRAVDLGVIGPLIVVVPRARERHPDRARSPLTQPATAPADTFGMLSFQRLDVYQRAIEFLALSLEIIRNLPKGHAALADQLRRSAESTPQNIAEGAGRVSRPDKARHYAIARGSAMESACSLDVMKVEELISADRYERGVRLLEGVVAMLTKML